jgi:uncharacterized protein YecE (DUF72 family)
MIEIAGSRVFVGTSGWVYPHWRGRFYPNDLAAKKWLRFAAERFDALEVNTTFYGSARPTTFAGWLAEVRDLVPSGFRFAIKGSRFITHIKRLRDVEQPLANFFSMGLLGLGAALGPILWQLPPQLAYDEDRLEVFLSLLPRTAGKAQRLGNRHDERFAGRADPSRGPGLPARAPLLYAIEPRHPSFGGDRFLDLCRAHDVAAVVADLAGRHVPIDRVTSSLAYLRLHGSRKRYASKYSVDEIEAWRDRILRYIAAGARQVHVYFDNDGHAHAAHDAIALGRSLVELTERSSAHPGAPHFW